MPLVRGTKSTQGSKDRRASPGGGASPASGSRLNASLGRLAGSQVPAIGDGSPTGSEGRVLARRPAGSRERPAYGLSAASMAKKAKAESRQASKLSRGSTKNVGSKDKRARSMTRSKDRRGSRSPDSSRTGSKTPMSYAGSVHPTWEDSSSSEELTEDDFAGCDPKMVPLHLRNETVLRLTSTGSLRRPSQMLAFYDEPTKEMVQHQALVRQQTAELERASQVVQPQEPQEEEEPKNSVTVESGVLAVSCGLCLIWAALACGSLAFFAFRFFSSVRGDFQRFVAEAALLEMETAGVAALSPAASLVRALALAAQTGFFDGRNSSLDVYAQMSRLLTIEMKRSPDILRVQVFNATPRAIVATPGDIHNRSRAAARLSTALSVNTFDVAVSLDELVQQLGVPLAHARQDGASVAWTGPEWLHVGPPRPEPLEEDFQLAYRLLAVTYDTAAQRGAPPFAVDVAIGLSSLRETARRIRPAGGEAYVCTGNGVLLAGSNWEPRAFVGNASTPSLSHTRLWDMPMPWAQSMQRGVVRSSSPAEAWHGRDLIAARPISSAVEEISAAHLRPALRALVLAPQDSAVSPLLGQMALAGAGLAACPPVVLVLLLLGFCVYGCCSCCCRIISRKLDERRWRKLYPNSEVM